MNRFFIISLFVLTFSMPAMAQSIEDLTAGNSVSFLPDSETEEKMKALSEEAEGTWIEDKYATDYHVASVANLSKLYLKKETAPLSEDAVIDNYLLINECEIYQKFFNDDFEWVRIRDSARKMLSENRDEFGDKFKIIVPIDLGRYDLERKGFPLTNQTAFLDMRRVEIGGNASYESICGKEGRIAHYPRNVIMIMSTPLNYDFVDVDEHIAQAFIIRRKYEEVDRPKAMGISKYNRLAFARMRITFKDYQGEAKANDSMPIAIMFGKLDGIDIFEDFNETRLLSTIDYN